MRCLRPGCGGAIPDGAAVCPSCGIAVSEMLRMLGVLPPGTDLQQGTYQLTYPLGQGGFGVTYRARHTEFDDDVAIKEFFPRDFAARDAASPRVSAAATHQDTYQRWLE